MKKLFAHVAWFSTLLVFTQARAGGGLCSNDPLKDMSARGDFSFAQLEISKELPVNVGQGRAVVALTKNRCFEELHIKLHDPAKTKSVPKTNLLAGCSGVRVISTSDLSKIQPQPKVAASKGELVDGFYIVSAGGNLLCDKVVSSIFFPKKISADDNKCKLSDLMNALSQAGIQGLCGGDDVPPPFKSQSTGHAE